MSRKVPIQVHIRARPSKSSDGSCSGEGLTDISSNTVSAYYKGRNHQYQFDRCYGPETTQEDVFDGVMPILEDALAGKNAVVFTYGVTGSGKTHTIQGTPRDAGLVPRVMQAIFDRQHDLALEEHLEVSFSYVEILKEKLWDLLKTRDSTVELKMFTDSDGQAIIPGMSVVPLDGIDHFMTAYSQATLNRTTAATRLNSASSRSHAILCLYIDVRSHHHQGVLLRRSKISSAAINQSLTTLGKVIKQINKLQGASGHIPFRESKLTRILSDALGGSSIGLLLCCLAPGQKFAVDTVNTLKFAAEAKLVSNTVTTTGTGIGRQSLPARPSQASRPSMLGKTEAPRRHTMPQALLAPGVLRPVVNGVSNRRAIVNLGKENPPRAASAAFKPAISDLTLTRLQAELTNANVQVKELTEKVKVLKAANEELRAQPAQTSSTQPLSHMEIAALPADEREARMRALYKAAKQYQADGRLLQARDAWMLMASYLVNDRHKHQEVLQRAAKLNLQMEGSLPITPGPAGLKRSREALHDTSSSPEKRVRMAGGF